MTPPSPRVLLLAPGGSVHSRRFLDWLQRAGCETVFLDAVRPANLDASLSRHLNWPAPWPWANWSKPLTGLQRYLFLRQLAARLRPDVVHIHYLDNRAFEAARARLPRLVISCWGSDVNRHFQPGASPRAARRAGFALRRASHVFADAPGILEKCTRLARAPLPASLLFFGVDTAQFHPERPAAAAWRQALNIPAGAHVAVSIRSFQPHYQQERILAAFAEAQKALDAPGYLILKPYAADSAYVNSVKAQAEASGLSPWLRWLEDIPDERMPDLYAMADVVLNYPAQDAFPVSFLEAAASGRLAVSCKLPAYAHHGLEQFFTFSPPGDQAAFAAAIVHTLGLPAELRAEKQALARRWALGNADERACIEKALNIYRGLLREPANEVEPQ